MKRWMTPVLAMFLLCGLALTASETIDSGMNWRIRREAVENSQVMRLVHRIADVHGPRLTGSPALRAACEWSIGQMKEWGLQNAHLGKWDFRYAGWEPGACTVRVVSPYQASLGAMAIAWTPGTNGRICAGVMQIKLPDRPSQESLTAYLETVQDGVRGKIVLAGAPEEVPFEWNAPARRLDDSDLRAQFDPDNPAPRGPQPPPAPELPPDAPRPLETREIEEQIDSFLLANGALVKMVDAQRPHSQLRVGVNSRYDASKAIPGIVIRNEDFGRISRILADGIPVEMEIEIANTLHPEGQNAFNAVADIPGTDRKEQIVMMGAHIDSWHSGTGATDNATGVAVMMEAVRILKKLDARPRRTIRVALWGGEEQGLLGSKAYVEEHFGTFEEPKPDFDNLAAYVNLDSGTGRVRGAFVFGPPEAASVLRRIFEPFRDLGVVGANAVKTRSYGITDSTSFNHAGLPGIYLTQDPIEYTTHSWHTDLDTYERALEGDLIQCATVVASTVYHLAMRDALLPRFDTNSMPPVQR